MFATVTTLKSGQPIPQEKGAPSMRPVYLKPKKNAKTTHPLEGYRRRFRAYKEAVTGDRQSSAITPILALDRESQHVGTKWLTNRARLCEKKHEFAPQLVDRIGPLG